MRMAGGNGSAASSLVSGSVMDRPCAAAICRDEAVFTTCYFAPMGRGRCVGRCILHARPICVPRPRRLGSFPQPHAATVRCSPWLSISPCVLNNRRHEKSASLYGRIWTMVDASHLSRRRVLQGGIALGALGVAGVPPARAHVSPPPPPPHPPRRATRHLHPIA